MTSARRGRCTRNSLRSSAPMSMTAKRRNRWRRNSKRRKALDALGWRALSLRPRTDCRRRIASRWRNISTIAANAGKAGAAAMTDRPRKKARPRHNLFRSFDSRGRWGGLLRPSEDMGAGAHEWRRPNAPVAPPRKGGASDRAAPFLARDGEDAALQLHQRLR